MKKEIEIPEEFMTEELEAIAAESEDAENAKAPEAENTTDGDKTVPLAALQRERQL